MHIKITNGTPEIYTIGQLRRDNPKTSFPKQIPDEMLAEYGVYHATVADRPADQAGKVVEKNALPTLVGGQWVLGWTVRDATAQEVSDQRARMHRQVASQYSQAMAAISTAYPPEEREGWPEQVAAAEAVIGGGTSALIDALRAGTGETATEMAQTIMTKRAQYMALYGAATGNRRALDAQITAAVGKAELDLIDVTSGWS